MYYREEAMKEKCATMGCEAESAAILIYPEARYAGTSAERTALVHERVCAECGRSYMQRTTLRAALLFDQAIPAQGFVDRGMTV